MPECYQRFENTCKTGKAAVIADALFGAEAKRRTEWRRDLVVIHTHEIITATEVRIRIISARKADRQEIRDYENAPR